MAMRKTTRNPRILVVTPEITYLPAGMGNMANSMSAKAGGMADVSASLISALFDLGADVHVALPNYRSMFNVDVWNLVSEELRRYRSKLSSDRIHLAEDRIFYYRNSVYSGYDDENPRIALAFQREVLNNILPLVQPDLIHCNDWMTGMIPAMARRLGIPCLFTVHNIHTCHVRLAEVEDRGIDAAGFWQYLYYKWPPGGYEATRATNPVDLLTSGIFAGHFINTVSPTFLREVVDGQHDYVPPQVRAEMAQKLSAGCAAGILNAPDPSFDPATDPRIECVYTDETLVEGKRANKHAFQEKTGLDRRDDAPLFFWPSRLDPVQKGCQLLANILYEIIDRYWGDNLHVAIVANGAFQQPFRDIVHHHGFYGRVAVCDFSESLSHLGYAASDFMLMPSRFEPCGLPQMVSALYGSLPVVHDTGGLHDTVEPLQVDHDTGNGILFDTYDTNGLRWAVDRAMDFWRLPKATRVRQVARIMRESKDRFNHRETAKRYFDIYESMLRRPLVNPY